MGTNPQVGTSPAIPRWRQIMYHVLNVYGLLFAQSAVILFGSCLHTVFTTSTRYPEIALFGLIIIVSIALCWACFTGARRLVDRDASRRQFQFSLRTMLVLTTIFCVMLGLWAMAS